jgi:DNA (cytosine-5)-methyltransferase 1
MKIGKQIGLSHGSEGDEWLPEPDVGRVAHGIPARVDRLRGLGNAIVPQVAFQILKAIRELI